MPYNDDNWRYYPYYIKRDCATDRKSYSIKLSKPIRNELDAFFDDKYGKGNRQQGLHEMVMEYLNTKCMKQSYFGFKVYMFVKSDQNIIQDDLLEIGILNYNTMVAEIETKAKSQKIFYYKNDDDKIHINGIRKTSLFDKLADKDLYFNHFNFSESQNASYDEFKNKILDKLKKEGKSLDDIYELTFFINNYLDFKIKGEYRSTISGTYPMHHGAGVFKDTNNQTYYYDYHWIYSNQYSRDVVTILDFQLLNETDFVELIRKSESDLLKTFVSLNNSYKFTNDIGADIDAQIKDVEDNIEKSQKRLEFLKNLKEQTKDD